MTYINPEPMTQDNTALVLVDHQVGLMTGVRDYPVAELKHNVVGLAKAAKAPSRGRQRPPRPPRGRQGRQRGRQGRQGCRR